MRKDWRRTTILWSALSGGVKVVEDRHVIFPLLFVSFFTFYFVPLRSIIILLLHQTSKRPAPGRSADAGSPGRVRKASKKKRR